MASLDPMLPYNHPDNRKWANQHCNKHLNKAWETQFNLLYRKGMDIHKNHKLGPSLADKVVKALSVTDANYRILDEDDPKWEKRTIWGSLLRFVKRYLLDKASIVSSKKRSTRSA